MFGIEPRLLGRWARSLVAIPTELSRLPLLTNPPRKGRTERCRYMEEWRYSSTILDLWTRWRWAVSFTPWPLCSGGKSPCCPLDTRMDGPHRPSGCCGEEKNHLPLPRVEPRPFSPLLYQRNVKEIPETYMYKIDGNQIRSKSECRAFPVSGRKR
jgi:hypothetical protein